MATRTAILESSQAISVFRGFYARIAKRLNVDPSYVSRVARGERESPELLVALEQEMRVLANSASRKSSRRRGPHRKGSKRNGSFVMA